MLMRTIFLCLLILLLAACNLGGDNTSVPVSDTPSNGGGALVVAWVEAGNLVVWRQGDDAPRRVASGGVVRPYIAPDGQHIAFTRGPQSVPETLWVVDFAGTAEQALVTHDELVPIGNGQPLIGDVVWYDELVLYFNTLQRYDMGTQAENDLYRANVRTREVSLILPRTEGGRFYISPNKEFIAVVYPGTYDVRDGRISVIDPLALESPRNLLYFLGVSTGSEYSFYPELYWQPDSSAVLTAIPDSDLLYNDGEDAPATTLWQLPIDVPGNRGVIGTVQTSFFGLPRWSDDTAHMTYLRRVGVIANNQFELFVADVNGENAVSVESGQTGELQPALWIPGTERFIYTQGAPRAYWLGAPGSTPERLSEEAVFIPRFVDSTRYVFGTPAAIASDGVQLRYARIGSASEQVASINGPLPVFDAVLVVEEG